MDFAATRNGLYENVVAVPTTIWKGAGELDLEANAANAEFLFKGGVTAAVYAGGVGEHDRLSIEQQKDLLEAVGAVARASGAVSASDRGWDARWRECASWLQHWPRPG